MLLTLQCRKHLRPVDAAAQDGEVKRNLTRHEKSHAVDISVIVV